MVSYTQIAGFVLAALAPLASAAAVERAAEPEVTVTEFPEVIPGPGLPSLESLGLTSADLYKKNPEAEKRGDYEALRKRYFVSCLVDNLCTESEAMGCYNYLLGLGNTACVVQGSSEFCRAGNCKWVGRNFGSGSSISGTCASVANGGIRVINTCKDPAGTGNVGGSNAAFGLSDLIVFIEQV